MKNTILLFSNMKEPIDELDDEDAGKLFKAILAYQNGEEVKLQGLLKVVFLQIKQQIDYNNERYAETSKKRSEARKAWLLKQQTSTNDNKTQQNPTSENNTHLYDNDNDNGNGNDNVIENVIENENGNDNENENESENVCSSNINNINSPTARAYGRFSNIILEKHQYDDLKKEFPEADEAIEKMSAYLANEKKTYKNYYARLRLWILQDRKDGKSPEPKKKPNPEPYEYDIGAIKV